MATEDFKIFQLQLTLFRDPRRCLFKAILRPIGCTLVVLCIMLSWVGIATAQQVNNSLQHHKAELEVQKLELEVAKLREDREDRKGLPQWLMGAIGLMVGAGGVAPTVWVAKRKLLGELDQSVHDKRLEFYPTLVAATKHLAIYFPSIDSSGTSIGRKECIEMGQAMSTWYFEEGGLFLSPEARDVYFRIARALTLASLVDELKVPTFPKDAKHISAVKVDEYRKELDLKRDLNDNDVERWAFGDVGSEEDKLFLKFKDFVFLQRLSSDLRTNLAKDLRSRRRPYKFETFSQRLGLRLPLKRSTRKSNYIS